ncbi:MAG: CotH kinase family protein [Planctomycetota bacterium]
MTVLLLGQMAAGADVTSPGDTVRGVPNDGDWPANEAPSLAIDDDARTKYLHFKGDFSPDVGPTGFQVTTSGGASVVTGLTFTTANDAPGRDPIAFELSGSNQSINGPYTLIASGNIVDFMQGTAWPRFTTNTTPITFHNETAYVHYQLLFTAIRGPVGGSVNSMQIAEVELLGSPAGGLPPEVDAGDDQIIPWKGAGNTIASLYPAIYDDDPCNIGQTNPDYLTILWSSLGQSSVDFMGTQTKPNAQVSFPQPGVYELQLQVWDEHGQEGNDFLTITVVEPDCPPSDLSGDCKVNYADLAVFAEQWLHPPGCLGDPPGCADLAGNDGVNLIDFALLAEDWQEDWTGSLRIIISPAQAVSAGARWRLDGGSWQDSGDVVKDLLPGTHTVEFSIVGGWIRPSSKVVRIHSNQMTTDSGTYAQLPDSPLLINEIMAVNNGTYPTKIEGREVFSDWIEIHNAGSESINLRGWSLTDKDDELAKWPFPGVSLEPGGYLVVYASGIEEADHPENYPYQDDYGRYHTNFKLDSDGEYLALVSPNGQIAHDYREYRYGKNKYGYPVQEQDISYGFYANEKQFFTSPTPGKANTRGFSGISERPLFSHPGGTFVNSFSLVLTASSAGANIRYTLDGTEPTETSRRYVGPVLVSNTVEVQARAYEAGKAPSPVVSHSYIALANDVRSFSSNLPIVIVDTNRQNIIYGVYKRVSSVFIDTDVDGRSHITGPADFAGRGGIKTRGRSTAGAPKHSYGFEVWDEDNQDRDVSIFGLPAESDWILYAPYNFDRAIINNAFMFELSNRIGRYAVRTRFVEMYLNTGGGKVSSDDYVGIYIFMEKIKRGDERVNVEKLDPWDSIEPGITGGYMLKIDRPDSGDSGFRTSRGNPTYGDGTMCYVDPTEDEITAAQSAWIRSYLDDFENALYGARFTDPQSGYARFIDAGSFIDHNLLNMLAMNVDALRLSTHLHKSRNGKLEMGPIWDFDRSLDSTDGRDDNPESWHGTGDGTDYLNYIWWDRLFDDPDFWQKYIDRWFELRQGPFSTENINTLIDSMADELKEAQVRNFNRWPNAAPRFGSFQGEIDHLKNWLARRTSWVDTQLAGPLP